MIELDYSDSRPLYEQIKDKIKFLIIRSVIKPEDKLPSVRDLAQKLTINPNTIQKAYKDLETEGYIYSVLGKGRFVASWESANSTKKQELMTQFNEIVLELKYLNVSRYELEKYLKELYQRARENPEGEYHD